MRMSEKTYGKVVDYVREGILSGTLKPGDKLPPERDLAENLATSRNSVREGLRILEHIGVLSSQQGSGNYLSLNFDETMSETLSFMYLLKGFRYDQITEFRYAIERQAMELAVRLADEEQKERIARHFKGLEEATEEAERVRHDKALHEVLVEASHNDLLITNYRALTIFMDRYIASMRTRIISGMKSREMLEATHRRLVEGVVEGNLEKGLSGLKEHFEFIERYADQ